MGQGPANFLKYDHAISDIKRVEAKARKEARANQKSVVRSLKTTIKHVHA